MFCTQSVVSSPILYLVCVLYPVRSTRFILTEDGKAGVGAETVEMEVQMWEQNQTVNIEDVWK